MIIIDCCGTCKEFRFDKEEGFYCDKTCDNVKMFNSKCKNYTKEPYANEWAENIMKG